MTQSMQAHARGVDAVDAPASGAPTSTVTKRLECRCGAQYPPSLMLRTCPACNSANLRYTVSGRWTPPQEGRRSREACGDTSICCRSIDRRTSSR